MRTLFLACFIFVATITCAQVNISGKVVSSIGNLPVAGASVYINNSSVGTTTNDKGEFTLKAGYSGRVDLVVSHISFEKKILLMHTGQPEGVLIITVDPKNAVLNEVVITADPLKGWNKWRNLFTDHFIGTSAFAKKCAIKNPEVLMFHYNKADGELTVTSRNTLLVENRALGYLYKIDLNTFHYSFKTLLVNTDITALFENLSPVDSTEHNTVLANRKIAYSGSKMDFIRSVYKKNYTRRGFTIIAIHLKKNAEKLRVQHLESDALAKAYQENRSPNTVTLASIANGNRDSVFYYEAKLGEPDYVIKDTTSVSLRDSLTLDLQTQNERLHVDDTLMVQYAENHGVKQVRFQLPVKNVGFNVTEKQVYFRRKEPRNMQYSLMILTPKKDLVIYPNGGYDDGEIFTDGYMANGKVSYLLPWDYKVSN